MQLQAHQGITHRRRGYWHLMEGCRPVLLHLDELSCSILRDSHDALSNSSLASLGAQVGFCGCLQASSGALQCRQEVLIYILSHLLPTTRHSLGCPAPAPGASGGKCKAFGAYVPLLSFGFEQSRASLEVSECTQQGRTLLALWTETLSETFGSQHMICVLRVHGLPSHVSKGTSRRLQHL